MQAAGARGNDAASASCPERAAAAARASLAGTAARLVAAEGPAGLYRGLPAQLLKTVLVAALQLMVKEKSFGAAYLAVAHVQGARAAAAERRAQRAKRA